MVGVLTYWLVSGFVMRMIFVAVVLSGWAIGAVGVVPIQGPVAGMEFVLIPGGSFQMGSPPEPVLPETLEEVILYLTDKLDPDFSAWQAIEEERRSDERPQHQVSIRPFYLMTTEVTQQQWEELMGNNPSHFAGDSLPVESVSWDSVQAFIRKLNARNPGKGYRLPTESEWEYACGAGSSTPYCSGKSEADLGKVAWYEGNSGRRTHAVRSRECNGWGLYDMHGNVWEWCEDGYADSYEGAPCDGGARVTENDDRRVIRGGSAISSAKDCRGCNRRGIGRFYRGGIIGFRLVRGP
jgi:formylglycine-generating enzyme required for sulfatase activity